MFSILLGPFHNVSFLVQPINYNHEEKIIKKLKKFFVQVFSKNTNFYVVKTLTVQELIIKELNVEIQKILIHPFFKEKNLRRAWSS